MSENSEKTKNRKQGGRPVPFVLRLGNHKSCRLSLARLNRAFARGEIEEKTFRVLVYGISNLLAWFKFESEQDILQRVERLEEMAEQLPKVTLADLEAQINA